MKTRQLHTKSGFTLIEVLTAISVFGLIMISIVSCWKCIATGARAAQEAGVEAQRGRVAIRAIEDALLTAQMRAGPSCRYYAFIADTTGDYSDLSLTCRLPASFPGSSQFGDVVLRRVNFKVEADQDGGNKLVMTQTPMLMEQNEDNSYPIVLARDVTKFELEFLSPLYKDWTDEFLVTNQLPQLVHVTLGLGQKASSSQPAMIVDRMIHIPTQAH